VLSNAGSRTYRKTADIGDNSATESAGLRR
jgi:hypothetical protein